MRVGAGKYIMSTDYRTKKGIQVCVRVCVCAPTYVCVRVCMLVLLEPFQTNRGNPPCLALSITKPSRCLTLHTHPWKPSLDGISSGDKTSTDIQTHIHTYEPPGSSQAPLTQGHTQTGSFRKGLCQFASLRALQV